MTLRTKLEKMGKQRVAKMTASQIALEANCSTANVYGMLKKLKFKSKSIRKCKRSTVSAPVSRSTVATSSDTFKPKVLNTVPVWNINDGANEWQVASKSLLGAIEKVVDNVDDLTELTIAKRSEVII